MTNVPRAPEGASFSSPQGGRSSLGERRLLPEVARAVADSAVDVVVVDGPELIRADRRPLDDALEADLDNWQASPVDQRTEGAVIRATLTDPAVRPMVVAWLAAVGLLGGVS